MRGRAVEIGWLLLSGACAGSSVPKTTAKGSAAEETASVSLAPDGRPSPAPSTHPQQTVEPSVSGPVPPVARPSTPTVADAGLAPSSGASPSPPPRRTSIRLSGSGGSAEDVDLAAGDTAFDRGDLPAARRSYEAARALAPKSPAPAVGLARVRIALVDVPLDYGAAKGNAELAAIARELARTTKAASSFGPGFVELGRALLLLGDAAGAIEALRQATRLLPDEAEAHSQLAVALLATGHADEALRGFARAVEIDPGSAARHGNLGTALMMNGRTKEAIAEYEARVRIDADDGRAHSDLGTALLGTQDLERALSELRRAVQLDPRRATFHQNLGYALQQAGQVARGIAEYREALRLDSKLVSAWINLATALARDPSTRAEARAALERARLLSPDDPRVKPNFDELDALEKGAPSRAVDAGAGAPSTRGPAASRPSH